MCNKGASHRSAFILFPCPRLQFVHVSFATNPFLRFGVKEEWYSPTEILVVFGTELFVLLVVPRLEAFHFDSGLCFELCY